MSRLREALQRIEERAAAASAGQRPNLRVDTPAERPVPPSNVFAAAPASPATPAATTPATGAAASRSTAVTLIIEPGRSNAHGPTPAGPSMPLAPLPPAAVPTPFAPAPPAFANASFADVANSPMTTWGDTLRIDAPSAANDDNSAGHAVHAQHEQRGPHLPPETWQPVPQTLATKVEKEEVTAFVADAAEVSQPAVVAEEASEIEQPSALAEEPKVAIAAASEDRKARGEQPLIDLALHQLSSAERNVPDAPAKQSDASEIAFHPPSAVAAPHIPASRFAAAVDPDRSVSKPFQQTCRKILAALPEGGTHALLFAAVDAPYHCASTVANLAIAMTDQINAPVLAIDASRDAALTKELRVTSTNALMRILRGTTSWEDCIVQTSVPGLCLLPSKPGHDRVAPFAFQRLLAELKSQFGLLLIDVGTFDETTALSLAGLCTATYLTVRQGHTRKDRARAAQRQIKSNGASLAGCVMISPAA